MAVEAGCSLLVVTDGVRASKVVAWVVVNVISRLTAIELSDEETDDLDGR